MIILRRSFIEQREFVKMDRSRLSRFIGKVRRNIGTKLEKSILKDLESQTARNNSKAYQDSLKGPTNEGLNNDFKNLIKDKYKGAVVYDPRIESSHAIKDIDSLRKTGITTNKGVNPRVRVALLNPKNKSAVVVNNESISSRVHEAGHLENHYGKNKSQRLISDLDSKLRSNFNANVDYSHPRNLLEAGQDYIVGEIVKKEERNATKNGIKLLKDLKANEETIQKSEEVLGRAYQTYKDKAKNKVKASLRSAIQIPSRRKLTPSNTKDPMIYGHSFPRQENITNLHFGEESRFKHKKR